MAGPGPPPLAQMGMEARLSPGLCPWGRGLERETDLPQTSVGTISVVPLVEGQLLLVLQRHSGDRNHASGEVQDVVQAQVGGGICGKMEASPAISGGPDSGGQECWVSAPSRSFSERQPPGLSIWPVWGREST